MSFRETLLSREDFDLSRDSTSQTGFLAVVRAACDTKWYKTSWLGILLFVAVTCLNYVIGYYAIYRALGWTTVEHKPVRVFGDIVTVGWFALGIVALPWHQWEEGTCIKTRNLAGLARFLAWWMGTIAAFFIYGYMGQDPFFQTSLASNLTFAQKIGYAITFSVVGIIVVYWFGKLCSPRRCKRVCDPPASRKMVFLRLFFLIAVLFFMSYILCVQDTTCTYHLHHWWFGFVLIMLSSASLDNWFDYFLQGIFWTFLIESIFNYGLVFGQFFI